MAGQGPQSAQELVRSFEALPAEFARELAELASEQEIRLLQARYLGKKGRATELMKSLGSIPQSDRPGVGLAANQTREAISRLVEARLAELAQAELAADLARAVDVTLPGRRRRRGGLHPLTLVRLEIERIFQGMGFEVRTGPWLESEWNNFDALNTPADHPARDMQDTFFVEGGQVLRSHTSPVQIRTMLAGPPPVKIIAPGDVFRRDDDATHTPMFPQCEGLHVDAAVSFEDLKATLITFVQRFFGPETHIRLRPSFFPFTEPSAEVDASCFACLGQPPERATCRLCKGTGWIEIGGAGMVHPNVFKAVGYDKYDVTGFAFGMGVSRMAMLRYGVADLRLFYENDLRFLRQFPAG
ncbi:MAG: phenylalanine--tRNA ligase subunit alpha [Polyangia bacterium]|jgi:phenylalanyl-tRNA synthetase alpha chain